MMWAWSVGAFLLVLVLTPLARSYALARGLVDQPGPRRSHHGRIARGGGIGIWVTLLIAAACLPGDAGLRAGAFGSLLLIGLLGLLDDHQALTVWPKLGIQALAAVWALVWIGPISEIGIGGLRAPWLWSPLAAVAIVWSANFHNFMDGSDGLASAQGVVCGGLYALAFGLAGSAGMATLSTVLAAACMAFLVFNRPPARVFLGDVGSLSLGWIIGLLALIGIAEGIFSLWLVVIVSSVFLLDSSLTLAFRIARGRRWYTAHTDHAYQLLIRRGWSHSAVLAGFLVIELLIVAPAALLAILRPDFDWVAALMIVFLLGLGWVAIIIKTMDEPV